jgi:hypothetical protein
VFWYKAKMRTGFRVGSPQFWNLHKNSYNPNHEKTNSGDPNKAKKKTAIKVIKK